MLKQALEKILREALLTLQSSGDLADISVDKIELSEPKQKEHGDIATNLALVVASRNKINPRKIAQLIVANLPSSAQVFEQVEIAGPGFINFKVQPKWFLQILPEIFKAGENFGKLNLGMAKKVQIEFVSANPTGPLHIGHGRGAVFGDVLGNILQAAGYIVSKEYYVNDAGVQISTLGKSILLRMRELRGDEVVFPEDCYQGGYVKEIAKEMLAKECEDFWQLSEDEQVNVCGKYGADKIFAEIKRDLADIGVVHDSYFAESKLYKSGAIDSAFATLAKNQQSYNKDGALWFRSTDFGDDKDRVLQKSDGSLTYFAADIAYHKNKYDRGSEWAIDILGADHAGYVDRMNAAVQALGHQADDLKIVLYQLVNLTKQGELISMSTRRGQFETLADVYRDVGKDVCRYFFLMRSHQVPLDFDLDLARAQSSENPVYYIQYAHARIASIFRKAAAEGIKLNPQKVDLDELNLAEEVALVRKLAELPVVIEKSAIHLEPHRLAFYLLELAQQFQAYYSMGNKDAKYRVLGSNQAKLQAKLYLLKNIQIVLQNGLSILGLSAPEEMSK